MYYKDLRIKGLSIDYISNNLLYRSCESARNRCRAERGKYKDIKCELTPSKLRDALIEKESFMTEWKRLTKIFVDSGFKSQYRPTLDRIDESGHYEVDNIQAISHRMNTVRANGNKCLLLVYDNSMEIVEAIVTLGKTKTVKSLSLKRNEIEKHKEEQSEFDYLFFITQSEVRLIEQAFLA